MAFSMIALGLFLGKMLRLTVDKQQLPAWFPLDSFLTVCIRVVLLGINPIILIGAFWYAELSDPSLIYLPLLGIVAIMLGGLFAVFISKYFKLTRPQTGSMFVTGSFINLGSFGSLFCVLLLGEQSLAYVAMFRLFEELYYYTVCYPIAKGFGQAPKVDGSFKARVKRIVCDPFIMITFCAVLTGGLLNVSSWERIAGYGELNQILVPLSVVILLIPVGFSMRLTSVQKYLKLGLAISAVKYIAVPLCITGLALSLGLGELYDGYLIQVILVLTVMPTAVSSLVPPQIFKLDVELANSNWMINTGLMVVTIPMLIVIFTLIN